ncbi:MAG TPA: methylated-DNA--[protein]-cysteine S-methyltransferase [Caulobacteraceae bacterium]|jgi:methylated-DNA-[protein]-cysteine S-methyltransferase|nr:methylated-DNA--[protein]-cysteine S-methyltransferase [Caulobacteraceae bacterium]
MSDPDRLLYDRLESPIGAVLILADAQGRLRALDFGDYEDRLEKLLDRRAGRRLDSVEPASDPFGLTSTLGAYFKGDIAAIDMLAVEAPGTPFQRKIWTALRGIPAGTTQTYGQLAARIGHPSAVRAAGAANGANALAIVVPCHRVIGADGTLTGYAGGVERKRWLLAHEAAYAGKQAAPPTSSPRLSRRSMP